MRHMCRSLRLKSFPEARGHCEAWLLFLPMSGLQTGSDLP